MKSMIDQVKVLKEVSEIVEIVERIWITKENKSVKCSIIAKQIDEQYHFYIIGLIRLADSINMARFT